METKTLRRSVTLSDHLAMVDASNLSSLLKFREDDADPRHLSGRRGAGEPVTLASIIACEKYDCSSASSRTLLDIIREEQKEATNASPSTESESNGILNWKSFADRLRLRRAASSAAARPPPPELAGGSGASASAERSNLGGSAETSAAPAAATEGQQSARVSLMALLEQTERQWVSEDEGARAASIASMAAGIGAEEQEEAVATGVVGCAAATVCCVCMVRHKGAAFIPCGHTFCRLCSRELWVSRGNCPLCNRFILEILDIF